MFGAHPKTKNTGRDEKYSRRRHDERQSLFTQEPTPANHHDVFGETHYRQGCGAPGQFAVAVSERRNLLTRTRRSYSAVTNNPTAPLRVTRQRKCYPRDGEYHGQKPYDPSCDYPIRACAEGRLSSAY